MEESTPLSESTGRLSTPAARPPVQTAALREALSALRRGLARGCAIQHLIGESGVGKTTVLQQLVRDPGSAGPRHRFRFITGDSGGRPRLGGRARDASVSDWERALRCLHLERSTLVLLCDDAASIEEAALLTRECRASRGRLRLIVTGRVEPVAEGSIHRMRRLTRSETSEFLNARLGSPEREAPALEARAISRLHAWSVGLPGRIEEFMDALEISASRGSSRPVTAAEIDELARSRGPSGWFPSRRVG
ncbi:MAG: hypothetical protein SFX72_12180 [Isosphaeraceae bacterium]|nr:hypothetical protein [Isosphaeraceae bacterium]